MGNEERIDGNTKNYQLDAYNTIDEDYFQNQLKNELMMYKIQNQSLLLQNQTLATEKDKLEKSLNAYKNNPAIVGTVSEIIHNKQKAVIKTSNGMTFYVNVPENFLSKLNVEDRVILAQNNLAMLDTLLPEKDTRAIAFEINEKPKITLKQIGGLEHTILEIEETVILPMTSPELFRKFNIDSPKGILLYGPPGTGKTMLAKAIANKTKSTFINLSGSELVHKFIGEGAKVVKDLFKIAKEKAPTIIFIDEIDAVASYRLDAGTGADREVNRTMTQLLVEMDGFNENDNIKVIAATNRIDILDKAILRPGRFDRTIEVGLPNSKARKEIFKIYLEKIPTEKINLNKIVELSKNTSGADIKLICKEAAIFAIREKSEKVNEKHLEKAIRKLTKTEEQKTEEKEVKIYR